MNDKQSQIRILSVDDHPLLREGVASLLAGHADLQLVAEASNGREAVEQFRAHRPDVTLMDLQMPEMNGVEAMIAIRAEFPSARMIVLTTYAGDGQVLRALEAGAQAYLLKVLSGKNCQTPSASFMRVTNGSWQKWRRHWPSTRPTKACRYGKSRCFGSSPAGTPTR